MKTSPHILYEQKGFPVLQNRLFASRADARNCATGDIHLIQNSSSGLIENVLFDASLIQYDSSYHTSRSVRLYFASICSTLPPSSSGTSAAKASWRSGVEKATSLNSSLPVDWMYPAVTRHTKGVTRGLRNTFSVPHRIWLAELEAYAPLVTPGSYCVVFDTVVEDVSKSLLPDRPWGPGSKPNTAVQAFLVSHPEFTIDADIHNTLLITAAPDAYLKWLPST